MKTNTDERLERAIGIIEGLIALIREAGLAQSELFLEMAKLQLQLELNGISDDEFSAFCDAVEQGRLPGASDRLAVSHARPRRNGELRLMRRAWREPQDRASQRGARAGR
jgi:hypothetical protein